MAIISAFVGRSFKKEEEPLWIEISKVLNSLKNIGFSWEDAEESQAKPVSDKVKEKIVRNDLFIGILTKREPICSYNFPRKYSWHLFTRTSNWMTSYWVIQESGYALGKEKKVIFLVESGLNVPGGLNADFEYVVIDKDSLSEAIIKLNQIITHQIGLRIMPTKMEEIPSPVRLEALSPHKSQIQQQEEKVEESVPKFSEIFKEVKEKKFASADEMLEKLLQQEQFKEDTAWIRIYYHKQSYLSGRKESLQELTKIADDTLGDFTSVNAIADCYLNYDNYGEAKRIVQGYLEISKDYDNKLYLSALISRIHIMQKEFLDAKNCLVPYFEKLPSNSKEQNYLIYKTLGNIYKEQGELEISCPIFEAALNFDPTDLETRFQLGYDYGQINRHALAAYHYNLYLKTEKSPLTLNNLGAEYEHLKLYGKSISLYKKAMGKETLANANIARLYIEQGFFDEAKDVLDKAVEIKNHHENVDFYLNNLKTVIEDEEKEGQGYCRGC